MPPVPAARPGAAVVLWWLVALWGIVHAMSPTTPQPIAIYLKPYVRKFVLARLAGSDRYFTAEDRMLWQRLQDNLMGRQLVRVEPDDLGAVPRQRVVLVVRPNRRREYDLSHYKHRYVAAALTRAYLDEMCAWVDWHWPRANCRIIDSLDLFRERYAVTEEDHPLSTAERVYRLHRRRRTRVKR